MTLRKLFVSIAMILGLMSSPNCGNVFKDVQQERQLEKLNETANYFISNPYLYPEFSILFNKDILRIKSYLNLNAKEVQIILQISEHFLIPPTRVLFLFLSTSELDINLNDLPKNSKLSEEIILLIDLHKKVNNLPDLIRDRLFEQKFLEFPINDKDKVSNEFLDYILDTRPILNDIFCKCKFNLLKEEIKMRLDRKDIKEPESRRPETNKLSKTMLKRRILRI